MNSTDSCPWITMYTKMQVISETQNIIFLTFLGILIPITVTSNSLLAFTLIKTKQLTKSVSHVFIFLLCLSDIFAGAVTLPLIIIIFAKYRRDRICTLELVGNGLARANLLFSANIILIIVLNRYVQINPDLREITGLKKWLTSKTGSVVLLLLASLYSVINGLLASYLYGYYYSRIPNLTMHGADCVLFITIFGVNFNLFWKVKKHTLVNRVVWHARNQVVSTQSRRTDVNLRPNYFERFTTTVFLILTAIAVCGLPHVVIKISITLLEQSRRQSPQTLRFLYFMSFGILCGHSTINAVIIMHRNNRINAFLKEKVFRLYP